MNSSDLATFRAALDTLSEIRRRVDDWCRRAGASPDARHAVVLAVDEVCTNVVEHGYAGRDDGEVRLRFDANDDEIRIVVVDRGRAFDPSGAPTPDLDADWRERPIGGLGLHLVRAMVDDVRYTTGETGNSVTLIKRISEHQKTGAT